MPDETSRLQEGADYLKARGWNDPALVLVLGSGLKEFGNELDVSAELTFAEVPRWPAPKVEGHGGSLILGEVEGCRVACLTGRVHLYEGWTPYDVVRAVRTLRLLGAPRFLLTNAAGGVRDGFAAGDLMVLEDHLNLTGRSPLTGDAEPAFGPRFPDQSTVYDPELRELLCSIDGDLHRGVYAGWNGPTYETPAEVRMLRTLGADAIGMSTVHEAMALNAMGAKLAGISLISNLAAGISESPLDHQEVIDAGRAAAGRLTRLVRAFCKALATA